MAEAAGSVGEDSATSPDIAVSLITLSGGVVMEMSPAPATIAELKDAVLAHKNVPVALQKVMLDGIVLEDTLGINALALPGIADETIITLTLIVDESPLFSWDIAGNPNGNLLSGSGGDVCYACAEYDYVNVITQEPVRHGFHYFEFVMHKIGDEQWCGVTPFPDRAGCEGGSVQGWFYYCGRRRASSGSLTAFRERNAVKSFEHVTDGDVIGLILDADAGILVFTLNGKVQGAGAVPRHPLYLTTCLDVGQDHVELRKPPVQDSPLDVAAVRQLPLDSAEEYVQECERVMHMKAHLPTWFGQ